MEARTYWNYHSLNAQSLVNISVICKNIRFIPNVSVRFIVSLKMQDIKYTPNCYILRVSLNMSKG